MDGALRKVWLVVCFVFVARHRSRSRRSFDCLSTICTNNYLLSFFQTSRSIDSRVNSFDPSVKQNLLDNFVSHEHKAEWSTVKEKNAKSSRRFETATFKELSYSRCLDTKKGRLVDNSIHLSNIHHIRRAEHFIYIESQYFMGSSFMWSNDEAVKCGNMIAAEVGLCSL